MDDLERWTEIHYYVHAEIIKSMTSKLRKQLEAVKALWTLKQKESQPMLGLQQYLKNAKKQIYKQEHEEQRIQIKEK